MSFWHTCGLYIFISKTKRRQEGGKGDGGYLGRRLGGWDVRTPRPRHTDVGAGDIKTDGGSERKAQERIRDMNRDEQTRAEYLSLARELYLK